jgi:hypothetical protein
MPTSTEKIIVAVSRGRVNLGSNAVGKTFRINQAIDGEYRLVPMVVIPEREAWLWQDTKARESFNSGVKEAEAGMGEIMDFSKYLVQDAEETR